MFRLIGTLSGLEKEVRALKRDLAAYEKAHTNLQKGREAAEAREDATESKLRLECQAREGMVRKPPCVSFRMNPCGVEVRPCWHVRKLSWLRCSWPWGGSPARWMPSLLHLSRRTWLDAVRGRLEVIARKVAEDASQ